MHFAPDVLGELQKACRDNDVTLRVTPSPANAGEGTAPAALHPHDPAPGRSRRGGACAIMVA